MRENGTALPVSLGIIALAIAALPSLFVEGEATGPTAPGLHPTTEAPISALLATEGQPFAESDAGTNPQQETAASTDKASQNTDGADTAKASGVPDGYVYWKTVQAKVTAYEPSSRSCGKHANGKTSIGENAWVMDGVASDPRAIPYGCYVEIPGVGVREVDDTGSAMRHAWRSHGRYQVDLRMPYYHQAKRWGVKHLDIKLYRKAE